MIRRNQFVLPLGIGSVFFCVLTGACEAAKQTMVVNIPVADLRAQPHTVAQPDIHDPLEETQVIYGERVRVVKRDNGWAHVEAIEQPEYTHAKKWQGYPGWLPEQWLLPVEVAWQPSLVIIAKWATLWKNAYRTEADDMQLPLGTLLSAADVAGQLWKVDMLDGSTVWVVHGEGRLLEELQTLSPREKRETILRNARLLLGDPYYWGGRSPHAAASSSAPVTGVDCSGLVNLAYRAAGILIPRDAHEQHLKAAPVKAVRPADLIFLSERGNPKHIVHVMLYAGNGELIEGPGTGQAVRTISVSQRLGQSIDWLESGAVIDGQTVSFGSFLP